MKLNDINKINNIKMPSSRTVGYGYEYEMPMTNDQTVRNDLDNDDEISDDNDVESVLDDVVDGVNLVHSNLSMAPSKKVPNIKKSPNTANLL